MHALFPSSALTPWPHCHADMLQSPVTTPPGPEAIGDMPERGFKERLDDLFYCTLYNTVFYGKYPKGPELPRFTSLGYPPRREGLGTYEPERSSSLNPSRYASTPSFRICFTVTPSMPGVLLPLLAATVRQAHRRLRISVHQFHRLAVLLLRGSPDSTDRAFSAR